VPAHDDDIGRALRAHRGAARLTQAELAERAGISERAISDIERGVRIRVYPVTAAALATALALSGEERESFERAARAGRRAVGAVSPPPVGLSWHSARAQPLVGRDRELADAVELLTGEANTRLVTITGPGGVGKSCLAAEVCSRLDPESVIWVGLADVIDPELVVPSVALAAGLRGDASHPSIVAALARRSGPLVLDTFERVMPAAIALAELLDDAPGFRVLVTSRAPLRVRGEHELPLRPLAADAAARPFGERARSMRPDLDLKSKVVDEIAGRLSGLPLAIELAAAKVRFMSLPALAGMLDNPLDVLSGGRRDVPVRHRTMRATIRWSYELLSSQQQWLFCRLSHFAGTWDLEMADALAGAGSRAATLALVEQLCDQALVQPVDVEGAVGPSWRMLDPVREFGLEQLLASGAADSLYGRHAEVIAHAVAAAGSELLGSSQRRAAARLRFLMPDVRLALGWAMSSGSSDIALRIVGSAWMFWRTEGAFAEGRGWADQAMALPDAARSPHAGAALWGAGWLAFHQNDQAQAARRGQSLLVLATRHADRLERRNALTLLGEVALANAHVEDAVALLREALHLADAAGASWPRAASLLNLGTAVVHAGDPPEAERMLDDARRAFEDLGDRHFAARVTVELGYAALARGEPSQARAQFAAGLDSFSAIGERWGRAEAIVGLAAVAAAQGADETAALLTGCTENTYTELAAHVIAPDARIAAHFLDGARARLGVQRWSEMARQGTGLGIDEAAAVALTRVAGNRR
jgi:predicted ATPase/DNA-binding XRE family transcriptional regulator